LLRFKSEIGGPPGDLLRLNLREASLMMVSPTEQLSSSTRFTLVSTAEGRPAASINGEFSSAVDILILPSVQSFGEAQD
jgi:hypothetical protein